MLRSKFRRKQQGAAATEYALLAGLVGVVSIGAISFAGGSLQSFFTTANQTLAAVNTSISSGSPGQAPPAGGGDVTEEEEDAGDPLVMRFTGTNASFVLQPAQSAENEVVIDWGASGQSCNISVVSPTSPTTCGFDSAGPHTVRVYGSIQELSKFNESLLAIDNWGDTDLVSLDSAFGAAANLQSLPSYLPASVNDLSMTFAVPILYDEPVLDIPPQISSWDVSNVVYMWHTFAWATDIPDITGWRPSSAVNMSGMFSSSDFNQEIGAWRFPNAITLSTMFAFNDHFNGDISGWDTSKIIDFSAMFKSADEFNRDISGWDVSSARIMNDMFSNHNANMKFNQDLSRWDVSNVTRMQLMFSYSKANQNLRCWNVSKVTDYLGFNQFSPSTIPPLFGQPRPADCGI